MQKRFLLIMALSSLMANAQTKLEQFSYVGEELVKNGWGNSANGESYVAVDNGLSYKNLPVAGGKVALASASTSNVNLAFTTPATSTAYASFLLKVTNVEAVRTYDYQFPASTGYFLYFSPNSGESIGTSRVSSIGVAKGAVANTFRLGFLNTTGGTATISDVYGSSPVDYNVGETYFVVIKYDISTGGAGTTSMWVNPASLTEPTPTHTNSFGSVKNLPAQISSLVLRQTSKIMPGVEIDEIRLGKTWADVFPSVLSTSDVKVNKNLIANTLVKDTFRVLENAKIEIYTTNGALVKSGNYTANQDINVSDLNTGVYFVKITQNNQTSVVKIVKQ